MNEDDRFWTGLIMMILVAFCVVTITIGVTTWGIKYVAFSNGYESVQLQGSQYTMWVKAD